MSHITALPRFGIVSPAQAWTESEEPPSLFDMCYLYSVSVPDSTPQEMTYQVQQGRQSEYDCRYWLHEYDSCCGSYWGDDLFSGGMYTSDDDGCNERMVKTEDSNQS
ncbi:hypothetical protein CRYUN_Cryun08bG0148800 [Craigia yunnanensis]